MNSEWLSAIKLHLTAANGKIVPSSENLAVKTGKRPYNLNLTSLMELKCGPKRRVKLLKKLLSRR